jgi:hypothetical protein
MVHLLRSLYKTGFYCLRHNEFTMSHFVFSFLLNKNMASKPTCYLLPFFLYPSLSVSMFFLYPSLSISIFL